MSAAAANGCGKSCHRYCNYEWKTDGSIQFRLPISTGKSAQNSQTLALRFRFRFITLSLPPLLLVPGESSLLFCVLHNLLLDVKALPSADGVHVAQRPILRVRLFAKVQVLLLGGGHPKGIGIDDLSTEGEGERGKRGY